jgi:cytochrome d ubiquinol oxidase subunit I
MDAEILARIQFAFTAGFHFLFPPLSIGLGIILIIMETIYIKTDNIKYKNMTKFWVKVFALTFALGVATGIVLEFEFGTNWAKYSRYVGDVFGSALAAEGIFAFFLESGFLAILVFGWDKVSKRVHYLATILVALGAHLSAVWILVANSWQQTPVGHHIVNGRAEIVDFWQLVFNPSTIDRLTHTIFASWITGAFLVLSIAAYYLIKKRHIDFSILSIKIGLSVAIVASLLQLVTGHSSAQTVAEHQPAKLAAMEAQYETGVGDLYLVGWVDQESQEVYGIKIPGMLSYLIYGDTKTHVMGLNDIPEDERPTKVNIVFQAYHLMVGIGMTLIAISLLGGFFWWRGELAEKRWYLYILLGAVLLPQFANQLGWMTAEIGRQPWIVYGLLKTSDGLSTSVDPGQILFSLIMFIVIYALLFVLFIFLLDRKIKHGPEGVDYSDHLYAKSGSLFADHKIEEAK